MHARSDPLWVPAKDPKGIKALDALVDNTGGQYLISQSQLRMLPDPDGIVWLFDAKKARAHWAQHKDSKLIVDGGRKHISVPSCTNRCTWCVVPDELVALWVSLHRMRTPRVPAKRFYTR